MRLVGCKILPFSLKLIDYLGFIDNFSIHNSSPRIFPILGIKKNLVVDSLMLQKLILFPSSVPAQLYSKFAVVKLSRVMHQKHNHDDNKYHFRKSLLHFSTSNDLYWHIEVLELIFILFWLLRVINPLSYIYLIYCNVTCKLQLGRWINKMIQ